MIIIILFTLLIIICMFGYYIINKISLGQTNNQTLSSTNNLLPASSQTGSTNSLLPASSQTGSTNNLLRADDITASINNAFKIASKEVADDIAAGYIANEYVGEWIQIVFPKPIILTGYKIIPCFNGNTPTITNTFQVPYDWTVMGSNDYMIDIDYGEFWAIDQQICDINDFPSDNYFDMSWNTTSYSTYRLVINGMTRGILNTNPNAAIGGWYLFNSGKQVPYAPSPPNQNIITPINKINPASPRVQSWTDSNGTYYAIGSNFYNGDVNVYSPSAPFALSTTYFWATRSASNLYLACSDITQPLNKCIMEDHSNQSNATRDSKYGKYIINSYVGTTKSYAL